MKKDGNLGELRNEIDSIDSSVLELLSRRGKISSSIGGIKRAKGQPVYSPDRESQVYKKITSRNKGPLADNSVSAIFREIMSACLSLEQPLAIAYLGPELTFTHQASMKKFGSSVDYLSCDSIKDVFLEVENGNADYGVVPVENSIEGAINHTMDMFADSPLFICSEIYLRIRHSLLSKAGSLNSIKCIYSKEEVFGQCRKWLEKNLPNVKLRAVSSTARAAEICSRHGDSACLASDMAAKKYSLKVLARAVEDSMENVTRFLVIGKGPAQESGTDKTSIMFSVKDRPGVLHDMLAAFKKKNINLTKIESRPSKVQAWKYYFFLDMEGHFQDKKLRGALKALQGKCNFYKLLGSYPRG